MPKDYEHNDQVPQVNESNGAVRFYASQEEQELERLKESVNRSATEKFYKLMGMMKIGRMMKRAIIQHKV